MSAIHHLKERLKKDTDKLKSVKHRLKDVQDRQRAEKEVSGTARNGVNWKSRVIV